MDYTNVNKVIPAAPNSEHAILILQTICGSSSHILFSGKSSSRLMDCLTLGKYPYYYAKRVSDKHFLNKLIQDNNIIVRCTVKDYSEIQEGNREVILVSTYDEGFRIDKLSDVVENIFHYNKDFGYTFAPAYRLVGLSNLVPTKTLNTEDILSRDYIKHSNTVVDVLRHLVKSGKSIITIGGQVGCGRISLMRSLVSDSVDTLISTEFDYQTEVLVKNAQEFNLPILASFDCSSLSTLLTLLKQSDDTHLNCFVVKIVYTKASQRYVSSITEVNDSLPNGGCITIIRYDEEASSYRLVRNSESVPWNLLSSNLKFSE